MKVVMQKRKRNFLLIIVLLLFVSVESGADDNPSVHVEKSDVKNGENSAVTVKVQGAKLDDSECPCVSSDDKSENSKLEKTEQVPSISDDKFQISKSEDTKRSQPVADPKQTNEKPNECNQQSESEAVKSEDFKVEDSENPPVAVDDSKQQKSKEDDKNQKINLSDVNSQVEDNDHSKSKKRETFSDSTSFAFGLPRDASYFFDDLEPFINNSSDIGRIGRAAPPRDKFQKSRLNGKGKEIMDDDVDEDEEEEKNEENEKQDEEDYDDDEDVDSDCNPTTGCPTTPKCTTTRCPTTTTPCPPSTTKCTTKHQCPTTCKTTPQCTTKCPRVCGKGGNRFVMGDRLTTEGTIKWDADKKRIINKKRKVHSKVAPSSE